MDKIIYHLSVKRNTVQFFVLSCINLVYYRKVLYFQQGSENIRTKPVALDFNSAEGKTRKVGAALFYYDKGIFLLVSSRLSF